MANDTIARALEDEISTSLAKAAENFVFSLSVVNGSVTTQGDRDTQNKQLKSAFSQYTQAVKDTILLSVARSTGADAALENLQVKLLGLIAALKKKRAVSYK